MGGGVRQRHLRGPVHPVQREGNDPAWRRGHLRPHHHRSADRCQVPRRHARRCHRLGLRAGRHDVERWRGLGQLQEVHREREHVWRQEERDPIFREDWATWWVGLIVLAVAAVFTGAAYYFVWVKEEEQPKPAAEIST